ncbi:hypothetical protein ISS98_02250 [Dyella flagellata]
MPTPEAHARMRAYAAQLGMRAADTGPKTLAFGGGVDGVGVTSGTPQVYLVFYGSTWGNVSTDTNGDLNFDNDPNGAAPYLQELLKGLGTGGELWSGTMTQYCDGPLVAKGATSCPSGAPLIGYPTGGVLAGVWYDNSQPTPNATQAQLAQEAENAAAHFGNTTSDSNRYVQYVIVSPTGADPDGFQEGDFCAWHDYDSSPYGDIAYTNLPYVSDQGCGAGYVNPGNNLDAFSMAEGHEYAETITDQFPLGGWANPNNPPGGPENGDECAYITSGQGALANVSMGTGSFAMQSTWSNDTNQCEIAHPIVQ